VVPGLATGLVQAVQDRVEEAFQTYETPPEGTSVTEPPGQIPVLLPAEINGRDITFTTTVSVFVQAAALVPVTIYVVVAVGLAVGDAQLVQDRPVEGVQA
jgi:hypothetical protein